MQRYETVGRGAPADAAAPRRVGLIIALLLLPLAGMIVPPGLLARLPAVCLYRIAFGVPCWGCGMTRAISAVLHGEVRRAIEFNWRVVIVFPLLAGIWCSTIRRLWLGAGRSR